MSSDHLRLRSELLRAIGMLDEEEPIGSAWNNLSIRQLVLRLSVENQAKPVVLTVIATTLAGYIDG